MAEDYQQDDALSGDGTAEWTSSDDSDGLGDGENGKKTKKIPDDNWSEDDDELSVDDSDIDDEAEDEEIV